MIERREFADTIRECGPHMYRVAMAILQNSYDAEDAVSEAALRAYVKAGQLRKKESMKSWLISITVNEARKLYAKRKARREVDSEKECQAVFYDEHHELWDAVMKLKQEHREVIVLFYYEGFSIKEIAGIVKVKEGTVKSRLSRAKQQLKEWIA